MTRIVTFADGFSSSSAPTPSDSSVIDLSNNTSNQDTNLDYNLTTYRMVKISYSIRRFTDSNASGRIETGKLTFVADDNQALQADKWVMFQDRSVDGTDPGVTFSKSVTSGVLTVLASTTNLSGANHHCYFSYSIEYVLV